MKQKGKQSSFLTSKNKELSYYLHKFAHLRTDRSRGWDASTTFRAPHKPFLLLSVIDLFAQGRLSSNLIEVTPELGEIFAGYWGKVLRPERRGNMALPFFHLRSSGFWHLIPHPGEEKSLEIVRQLDTLGQLGKVVIGASLDEELYSLLQEEEARETLRAVLIQTYFAPQVQGVLREQCAINREAYLYSQELIERARHQVKETPPSADDYPLARDQGFRRAVVRIYNHSCAFCGLRLLTSDGRTVVDAAHIIPWSVSHDDDLHNGMALCRLCHWTFDQGLLGVSSKYLMLLSDELRVSQNKPGYILNFEGRSIIGPGEEALWPCPQALGWHRVNVFRRG
jgi:putative restriction endonuclease